MIRWVGLTVAAVVVIVVGNEFGWRWILAPLLGFVIWRWASSTLRSMVHDGQNVGAVTAPEEPPGPVDANERTLYWCEECGTELLLLVRGSGISPRHCGTRMHERSEILN